MTLPADTPISFRAQWVLPVDEPPIRNGIVTIRQDRIVSVGEGSASGTLCELGMVALMPGLVNAHTHLEFSDLTMPLGTANTSFAQWIGKVVQHRGQINAALMDQPAELAQRRKSAVELGLRESLAAGVAAIGEIATRPWFEEPFLDFAQSADVVIFLELIGLAEDRIGPLLFLAQEHLSGSAHLSRTSLGIQRGLSPHAPYTVHPDLLLGLCNLSQESACPVAMHLAESFAELELLRSHSGPLVELLKSLGAWHPNCLPRGMVPLDILEMLAGAHRALVIHGNFLVPEDMRFLAAHRDNMSVVYCPRTQAFFSHGRYPLPEMLETGVRVAVGTDSRASNPDLSLWRELQHIARAHPVVSPEEILKMGTLSGAEALGIEKRLGTLTPGKAARLAIVPLPSEQAGPYESLSHPELDAISPTLERSSSGIRE